MKRVDCEVSIPTHVSCARYQAHIRVKQFTFNIQIRAPDDKHIG